MKTKSSKEMKKGKVDEEKMVIYNKQGQSERWIKSV